MTFQECDACGLRATMVIQHLVDVCPPSYKYPKPYCDRDGLIRIRGENIYDYTDPPIYKLVELL